MRWVLLAALLFTSACWRHLTIVPRSDLDDLQVAIEDELNCSEVDVRALTLLTRRVEACGHERVYAWDPLGEKWILASVEKR